MAEFTRATRLPVPAFDAYRWHVRPGALERLTPPWEEIRILGRTGGGIEEPGSRVALTTRIGPFRKRWVAEHRESVPGHMFKDVQVEGPFARWEHTHRFRAEADGHCVLEDRIEYELPAGWIGRAIGARSVERRLARVFAYRHRTVAADVAAHRGVSPLRIAITGAGGLIGSALVPYLSTGGHEPVAVRRKGDFDLPALEGADAVVHLAGESIASGRWTRARKERILMSRVEGTRRIAERIARMERTPRVLVCASAIGWYGDRGDEELDERSAGGEGFLPDVCRAWESAADPARARGVRVVHLRFGVVLSPRGGALKRMLTPFRLGLGGRIGSGRQHMSWISIDDAVGAIHAAIRDRSLDGPVNAVSPAPVTNARFSEALARVLRRPAVLPMPAFAARLAFGEMADALLLASARVLPRRLEQAGYRFRDSEIEACLGRLLGRSES